MVVCSDKLGAGLAYIVRYRLPSFRHVAFVDLITLNTPFSCCHEHGHALRVQPQQVDEPAYPFRPQ